MPARRRGYSTQQELLEQFEDDIRREIHELDELRDADVIVGIPFHDEEDTLPGVVHTACRALEQMRLTGKSFVLCVGPEDGGDALDAALNADRNGIDIPVRGFLLQRGIEGRSWTTCAIMKAAAAFKVPLVLLPPDLVPQPVATEREGEGFSPHWISRLLRPVRDYGQHLALAHFSYHPLAHPVESLLTSSFIEGVYGLRLDQPTPGVLALSNDLVQVCVSSTDMHSSETGNYGLDPWLVIRAILNRNTTCQAPLGMSSRLHPVDALEPVFLQVTQALFLQAVLYSRLWLERPSMIASPSRFGTDSEGPPPALHEIDEHALFKLFKKEYNRLDETLIREVVPDAFRQRLEQMAKGTRMTQGLDAHEWIEVLRGFLLLYGFEERFHPVDIVSGLFPFFLARLAGFNA
ncbi:MAG: hypothetical protein HY770_06050, partial [Chitinivibrionia bacterium]|nr:hypothetical protein [Chitinivibrionia bacterium]